MASPAPFTSEVDGVTHIATPRNELRMLIRVKTDLVGTFSLAEQAIHAPYPKPGEPRVPYEQDVVIYERQWPEVQKLVRTDAHNAALADAMAMAPGDPEIIEARKSATTNLARAKTPSERERCERELESIKADEFRKALNLLRTKPGCAGGLPPLLEAKPIKLNVPPPPTAQVTQQNSMGDLAAMIAQILQANGKAKAPKPE